MSEMNTNTDIQLLAGLSINESERQILNDIKTIQKRLEQAGAKFKLTAEMDNDFLKAIREMSNSKDVKNLGKSMADTLISQFNIVDKESQKLVRNLSNQLQTIRIGEIQTNTIDDSLLKVVNELGDAVVNSSNTIKSRLGIYDEFYNYFKKLGKISISDSIKSDLGADWNELRKLYPSKFTTNSNNGIELDSIYQEMSSKFKDIFSGVANPTDQFRELSQAIKNYRADVDQIEPITQSIELEDSVVQSIYTELAKLETALQMDGVKESITAISGEVSAMEKVEESAKLASQQKEKFADANEDVADSARRTTDAVEREADVMMDMNNLDSILNGINMSASQSTNVFNQLGQQFRDTFSAYSVANLMERALDEVADAGREALDVVKSFDDINVDLQMATGEDKEYVKQLLKDYSDLGDELSVLTQTVASSADSFLRQGRSMEETNQLIRDSVVLSKVAQTSGENASEILTATLNGFQLTAKEASRVNDVLSSIDLHSAADAKGIGEALTKVASMANNAGLSLEKTAAVLGTVKNNTQDLDKTIGTSLKTVLSRMSSIKAGKFIDEETGESLNDVEKVLGHISIETRDANGQFKDAEEILDAVGSKWNQLDRNTQNAVASAMAGTYQYNKLVSLFDNYSQALELTEIAENSSGTAMEKFTNSYLPSLEAKTQALTSSLQNLANVTISDELYGQILDLTKGMVDATAESGILKNALLGISGAGTIYAFTQIGGLIRGATQELSNFSTALNIAHTGNIRQNELQQLIDLSGSLSQSQTRLLLSTSQLSQAQRTAILMGQNMSQQEAELQLRTWNLTSAQSGLTQSTLSLGSVMKGMIATIASSPYVALSIGIGACATAYSKWKQSVEEARQASIQSATEAKELSDGIAELTNKYIELSDAVKTDSSVREQYLSIQDELIEKLGVEQSELQALTEQYGDLDTALKSISVDKLKAAQLDMLGGLDALRDDVIKEGKSNIWGTSNNITAKTNEDNAKAWDALEEAGIISQGQSSLYLNGDNSIDGILENYNALESALTALRESGKFTFDELSSNEVYQKIYDKWNGLKKPVSEYQSAIANLNNNQAQIVTLEALKGVAVPDTKEAYEDFRKDLIESAVASGEFIGTQEEIESVITNYLSKIPEFAKFTKVYEDLTNTANSAASTVSNATQSDAVTKLDSLKEGFAKLQEIYNNISAEEGTGITAVVDEDITEIFGGVTDELNTFIKTISESPNDIGACQSAFDNLIYSWLNSESILDVLNDDTVTLIGTFLEEQGVVNATSWLMDELIARKALAKAETEGLIISTADEITALIDEATYSDEARAALARLVLAKETLNGTNIDVSGDIQNLYDLCVQAQATQEALASLKSYRKASQDFGQTVGDEITADDLAWERERATGAVKSTLKYNPSEGKGNATNSGSGYKPKSTSTSKSGSAASKEFKEEIDWIARKNELLQKQHDIQEQIANDESASYNERKSALLDLIEQDKERASVAAQSASEYESAWNEVVSGLRATDVSKIIHGSLEIETYDAQELANQGVVGSVEEGEKYIENLKKAIELFDLKEEALLNHKEIEKESLEHQKESIRLLREEIGYQKDLNSAMASQVNSRMDLMEAEGKYITAGSYQELIRLSQEMETLHHDNIDALYEQLELEKEGSAEYYDILAEIESVEDAIIQCQAEQENWNYQIARLPINRIQTYIDMLETIKQDAENWGAEVSVDGISLNMDQYQNLIDINAEEIDALIKQQEKLQDLLNKYDYGSDRFNELSEEIQSVQNQMSSLIQEQKEYNHAILEIPVREMSEQIENLASAKAALERSIAEDNEKGLVTTISQYESLNQLTIQQLQALSKQRDALTGLLSVYDQNSDKYAETKDQLDNINQTISDLVIQQYQWNSEILQIPNDKLEDLNNNLQTYSSILGDSLSEMDSVLSGVIGVIEQQTDAIEEQRKASEDMYDERIERLEKEKELLTSTNNDRKLQLDYEQALSDLDRAQSQRTIQVVRDGKVVHEADQDAIRDAQTAKADAEFNLVINNLEKQIEALETEKETVLEGYDEQLDKLDDVKSKWSEIVDQIKQAADIAKADKFFGDGWADKVLLGTDSGIFNLFKDLYSSTSEQKESIEEQISSNERLIQMMGEFVNRYKEGSLTYDQALNNISSLIQSMEGGYSALENLSGMMNLDNILGLENITVSTQNQIDKSAELLKQYMQIVESNKQSVEGFETNWESMSESVDSTINAFNNAVDSMQSYLDVFNSNADAINDNTSTWEEMKEDIESQVEALKKAAEELEKLAKKTESSSSGSSGSSGKSSGGSGKNETYLSVNGTSYLETSNGYVDKETGNSGNTAAEVIGKYGSDKEKEDYWAMRTEQIMNKKESSDSGWLEAALKALDEEKQEAQKYHTGVEKGYVGKSLTDDDYLKIAQRIALDPLRIDEVVAVLKRGELVYTPEQVKNTVDNVQTISQAAAEVGSQSEKNPLDGIIAEPLLPHLRDDYMKVLANQKASEIISQITRPSVPTVQNNTNNNQRSIEMNFGGITVHEAQNAEKLMHDVVRSADGLIAQQLATKLFEGKF